MKYIIGIDNGTQSAKALIFDVKGNVLAEGKKALRPMITPNLGAVLHPDDDLWDSICMAGKELMKNFKGDIKDIVGIGLCTIRCCKAYLKEDGMLAEPVMSWMDKRAYAPYENENKDVKYLTTSSGYITKRLTDKFIDSVSANYQYQWPIDQKTWQWSKDPEVYKSFNMSRDMMLDLVMPGEILGYVTKKAAEQSGLPEGLPVVATANDKGAEALGAGLFTDDTLLVSLGTYICSMIIGHHGIKETANYFTNFSCMPNVFLYESGGIRRGMWTVSWFKNLLGFDEEKLGMSVEAYLDKEAKNAPAGSDGLMTILDWLAPGNQPHKKGIMLGFDGRHTRAHMFRSIIEAIALTMYNHAVAMKKDLNTEYKKVIISGGGSNSPIMMQSFADIFGVPVARNVVNGAAGLGSAICAAVATGVYPDFKTAIDNMVQIRDRFEPIEQNHKMFAKMNEIYKTIPKDTDEILKKSYEIFG